MRNNPQSIYEAYLHMREAALGGGQLPPPEPQPATPPSHYPGSPVRHVWNNPWDPETGGGKGWWIPIPDGNGGWTWHWDPWAGGYYGPWNYE